MSYRDRPNEILPENYFSSDKAAKHVSKHPLKSMAKFRKRQRKNESTIWDTIELRGDHDD